MKARNQGGGNPEIPLPELLKLPITFLVVRYNNKLQSCRCQNSSWLPRLRLLVTCSIMITNKQNHNEIDYDYTESNHDYNCDYICLETSSERKQIHLHALM